MNINPFVHDSEKHALALAIGSDGNYLLKAVAEARDPNMSNLHEITELQRIWEDQFEILAGQLSWRKEICGTCSFYGTISNLSARAIYYL